MKLKKTKEEVKTNATKTIDINSLIDNLDAEYTSKQCEVDIEARKNITNVTKQYASEIEKTLREQLKTLITPETSVKIKELLELNKKRLELEKEIRKLKTKADTFNDIQSRISLRKLENEFGSIEEKFVALYDECLNITVFHKDIRKMLSNTSRIELEFYQEIEDALKVLRAQKEALIYLRRSYHDVMYEIVESIICSELTLSQSEKRQVRESINSGNALIGYLLPL